MRGKYFPGFEGITKRGRKYVIKERVSDCKVLIEFLDDFEEKVVNITNIKTGEILHPKDKKWPHTYDGQKICRDGHVAYYVGPGSKSGRSIIRFDTGEEKEILTKSWINKTLLFPHEDPEKNRKLSRKKRIVDKYVGKIYTNKDGLEMQIVDYVDANDCTVKFLKSGYTVKTKIRNVYTGTVCDIKSNYLYKRILQRNGLWAEVTSYVPGVNTASGKASYVITWEDGLQVTNGIKYFYAGRLAHPQYPTYTGAKYKNGVKVFSIAFELGGVVNMHCICPKCGWEDICNSKEIMNHVCDNVV